MTPARIALRDSISALADRADALGELGVSVVLGALTLAIEHGRDEQLAATAITFIRLGGLHEADDHADLIAPGAGRDS